MRCRVTEVKTNMRNNYETHECEVCKKEEETQNHIIICPEITMKKTNKVNVKYENIFDGKVHEQLEIAKVFEENIKIRNDKMDKI